MTWLIWRQHRSEVGFEVGDVEPAGGQQLTGRPCELDIHHRVAAAVCDEHARVALQVRLPAVDRGDEAAEGHDPRGRRTVRAEAERVAHDRAHREPAEDRVLGRRSGALPRLVVEAGELGVGGLEGVLVGEADARHDVPVLAGPARDLQRPAGGDDVQPALRVQDVGEPEQVVLVGAAAVVEDEQALGRAVRGTFLVDQAHAKTLGFSTGRSVASSSVRRCSCCLGSLSASPRCSASSSTAKPGESVAISNRTPLGMRK